MKVVIVALFFLINISLGSYDVVYSIVPSLYYTSTVQFRPCTIPTAYV